MRRIVFLVLLAVLQPVIAMEGPPALQFDVVRYEVTGSNPLRPEVISKVLKPYLGRHHGLDGLSAAVDELERKLKKEGYSFHRVILQPQSLQQGIVKLKVHEFKLGKLNISGNKHFSDSNIRNSLPSLVEGQAPNTRLLNQSLAVANEHPDKTLQMIFKEGEAPNTIDVNLNVADKSPHTGYAQLSNTGAEETGDIRLGIGYQYSNLFDKDHIASINYSTSTEEPSNVSQWVMSYSFPFYENGDQLSVYYSDSEVEATEPLPGSVDLDISGAGTVLGARYMYSFKKVKGYKQKLYLGLDMKEFDNLVLADTGGNVTVVENATNKLESGPISIEYEISKSQTKTPFMFAISFYQNLIDDQNAYNDEVRYPISIVPDTGWNLFRYKAQYELPVASWLLRLRLQGQQTSEPLISGEQFGVGGAQSVRGYEERAILGDTGYSLNIEWWNANDHKKFSWLIFYDLGQTKYVESICETCDDKQSPSSFGAGLRWMWSRHVNISADAAQVQEEIGDTEKGDIKVHVSLTYQY